MCLASRLAAIAAMCMHATKSEVCVWRSLQAGRLARASSHGANVSLCMLWPGAHAVTRLPMPTIVLRAL